MRIRQMGMTAAACCAFSGFAVAVAMAPAAMADPELLPPPPAPAPGPAPEELIQAAAGDPAVPSEGLPAEVPHLSSLENLPPGTAAAPLDPPQGRGLSYLRDLWHAVQTQEVSGGDALLLLTQRPMDPAAVPPPGMPAGPMPLPEPVPAPAPTP